MMHFISKRNLFHFLLLFLFTFWQIATKKRFLRVLSNVEDNVNCLVTNMIDYEIQITKDIQCIVKNAFSSIRCNSEGCTQVFYHLFLLHFNDRELYICLLFIIYLQDLPLKRCILK